MAAAACLVPAVAEPVEAPAGATVVSDVEVADAGGRLHELVMHSPALGRDAGVRVLLPDGFDDPANAGRTWPILWLLHGAGDDHTTWSENTDVEGLTATLPIVVALPEAGRSPESGWYIDWIDGPAWETFHLRELLPLVEARFHAGGARPTGRRRSVDGRLRRDELCGVIPTCSSAPPRSPARSTRRSAGRAHRSCFELAHPYFGTPDDRVWGPYESAETTWRGHNPTDLAPTSIPSRCGYAAATACRPRVTTPGPRRSSSVPTA